MRDFQDFKISAANNSPRFLLRSRQDPKIKLIEILVKISMRSFDLGGQKLTKNLGETPSKISPR